MKLLLSARISLQVSPFFLNDIYLVHTAGYWPNYRKSLGILVGINIIICDHADEFQLWESMMTWRSTVKAKAREVLTRFYDIGLHRTEVDNQSQAQALIKGAVFLRNGVDDEVC